MLQMMLYILLLLLGFPLVHAFYIPGYSIKSYRDNEVIPLFINKVFSDNSELQYAYSELPFVCSSGHRSTRASIPGASMGLNLGEILRGDRITLSDYELVMGRDDVAHYLCNRNVDQAGLNKAIEIVRDGYLAEWIVDNLPGATTFLSTDKKRKYYASGFRLGYETMDQNTGESTFYINNHVTLVIRYKKASGKDGKQGKKVIVGFQVFPKSFEAENRNSEGIPQQLESVGNGMALRMPPSNSSDGSTNDRKYLTITYTYSVYFQEDAKVEWKNRWDAYFETQEDFSKTHWFAIINSLVILGLLTAVVAVIFARTIYGELQSTDTSHATKLRTRGNGSSGNTANEAPLLTKLTDPDDDISPGDEGIEEMAGWKLVHGDVFRTPSYGSLLAPIVGSGTQLVFMSGGLLLLGCFGVLNPSFRGGYITVGISLFVIAGIFSGYFSARIYKTFGGQMWRQNVIVTGLLIPGLLFATFFILNLFVWAQASSTAIPFGTLVALLALWLLIQLPLVYLGGWYGFVTIGSYSHPIKANSIPRQIPRQPWFTKGVQPALAAGLIPFLVLSIELLFVFKSLWQDKSGYYYVFGFLSVVSIISIITVIEVTIVGTYMQLCAENYHWWWHSFIIGGSSSIWIFMYCIWYYVAKLHISGFVSALLFFCYSFLACALYGLLTGTIGFLAAYTFVRKIYTAVKVD